ncbi:MAG: 4-hydroxy-tetrahydrodipicolinate reductase, partial [Planctomycetes bacterium]|nr:4-hydroxy-tetrahydrodipicolinate reductase [Planctomycetota bacterium]
LSAERWEQLERESRERRLGGLIAPNFAIGAILMMELADRVAEHMSHCEIIEFHHPGKLDAPSGTALRTRDRLQRRPGVGEVPIHSVRLPGYLAHQEVIFGSTGERLSIRHDTLDRTCFMPGVLLGIRKVVEIDTFVLGLEHFLKS